MGFPRETHVDVGIHQAFARIRMFEPSSRQDLSAGCRVAQSDHSADDRRASLFVVARKSSCSTTSAVPEVHVTARP